MAKSQNNTDRPTKRGTKTRSDGYKRSKKQQAKVDNTLSASRVPGSGAPSCCAGDSRYSGFLQENKTTRGILARHEGTKHLGIYIRGDWLIKITDEAASRAKDPALCFTVESLAGKRTEGGFLVEDTWVAIPISVYKARLEAADAGTY